MSSIVSPFVLKRHDVLELQDKLSCEFSCIVSSVTDVDDAFFANKLCPLSAVTKERMTNATTLACLVPSEWKPFLALASAAQDLEPLSTFTIGTRVNTQDASIFAGWNHIGELNQPWVHTSTGMARARRNLRTYHAWAVPLPETTGGQADPYLALPSYTSLNLRF